MNSAGMDKSFLVKAGARKEEKCKVLVNTDYFRETFSRMPEGVEVCFAQGKPFYSVSEMAQVIAPYRILVIPSIFPVSNPLLDRAENLELICNLGAGFNNVDVDYARSKGVKVCTTPDAVTQSTAELAITLMACLMRRVAEHDRALRERKEACWHYSQLTARSLQGKLLGIVGMGKIGRRVAEMAKVFRMEVIYANRNTEVLGYERVSLEELLHRADVVSLHVPLCGQNRHLIGRRELAWMKPEAVLVNTSRGPVVDEEALVEALQSGKLSGAALDVFEKEPHVNPALYAMPNVVITPHIGGNTHETLYGMMRDAAAHVRAYVSGETVPVVNP